MDRHVLEDHLRTFLDHAPQAVVAAYLFGSIARDEAGPHSDLDLGVLFDRAPESRLGALPQRLEGELEGALGVPVQLVVLNTAPPDLVHRVLRDGRLVLDRDRSQRLRFEVRARNEFFDLQPILKRYRAGGGGA